MKVSEVCWAKHLTRCNTPGRFLHMNTTTAAKVNRLIKNDSGITLGTVQAVAQMKGRA